MALYDHAYMHACNSNETSSSTTPSCMHLECHQGDVDSFNITNMKRQLEEISLAAIQPKYKPIHQLILNQIDARLVQINTINTVTGGAYDDVCKLYKELGAFASRAKNQEIEAQNAVAVQENMPVTVHPLEARAWTAKWNALDFDWTFYAAIKDWSELAEDWIWAVSKDVDTLNARVYPLQERLSTQKKRIEELYKKMREAKGKMDVLVYELEACSIELENGETSEMGEYVPNLNVRALPVPYLHYTFDVPHWSEEDELGRFALEARRLYNIALDIARRVYL